MEKEEQANFVRVNIRLSKDIHRLVKIQTKKLGLTVSSFMNVAAMEYLKQSTFVDMGEMLKAIGSLNIASPGAVPGLDIKAIIEGKMQETDK